MKTPFIHGFTDVIMIRGFTKGILIFFLLHHNLSAQNIPADTLYRGGTIWLSACSPDSVSPRICLFGMDLPESCSTTNRSAAVYIRWYDEIADRSFEFLSDSLVESTRKSQLESDPNSITIQDSTVGRFRTILRRSNACEPPCMLIDRVGPKGNQLVYVFATYPLLNESHISCYQPMLDMIKSLCDSPFKNGKNPPSPSLEITGNRITFKK